MEQLNYIRYLVALALVLGLIWLLGWAGKKFGWAQLGIKLATPQNKRIQIMSMQSLDTRHRLVLIRRDDQTEHLLAVGPDRVTVIESNITPPLTTPSTEETKA